MTIPGSNGSTREKLKVALQAVGLEPTEERIEQLLPSYEVMLNNAARLRTLDLGDTEPAIIFRLPRPE